MDSAVQINRQLSDLWKRTRSSIKTSVGSISSSTSTSSIDAISSPTNTKTQLGASPKATKDELNNKEEGSNKKVVRALFKYKTKEKSELSFHKGDKFVVLDVYSAGWWIGAKLGHEHSKSGCIPINYLSPMLENKGFYFSNTSKQTAEKLLLDGSNSRGCFLIRKSEHEPDNYVLSVRETQNHVKHYPIETLQHGDFYLNPEHIFARLDDLVEHYKGIESVDLNYERLTLACATKPYVASQPELLLDCCEEIKEKRLELVKELTWLSNDHCKVYAGLYRAGNKKHRPIEVGVKSLEPGAMSVATFYHEAKMLHTLAGHPYILSLIGVCTVSRPLIVMEYAAKGDLLTYLRDSQEADSLKLANLLPIAAQIASGLAYLECAKVVHRNLMARNCLLTERNQVKIGNFAHARQIEPGQNFYIIKRMDCLSAFPIKWTAPEALQQGIFSTQSDVWSYGIVLYEVLSKGMVPYPGKNGDEALAQAQRGEPMARPSGLPDSIYAYMRECCDLEPSRRPTFKEMHAYFDTFTIPDETESDEAYECIADPKTP